MILGCARYIGVAAVVSGLCFACKAKQAPEKSEPKAEAVLEAEAGAFEDRKRYPQLTVEILKGIPDAELERALVDFVDCKIEESGKPERDAVASLSPGFRAVYSTWILEGEVNNGGFNQFFWNSSGEFADEAADGFDLLGTKDYARLMRRAIAIRDADQPRMQTFKARGTIKAFSQSYKANPLNDLDDQFYKLGTELSAARIKFIRSRPKMFTGRCTRGGSTTPSDPLDQRPARNPAQSQ